MRTSHHLSKRTALAIMTVVLALASCSRGELTKMPTHTTTTPGDNLKVRGLVVENRLGAAVDISSYLILRVDNQEIRVVYDYGEWPPTNNREASVQGSTIKVGDEVEVYGLYSEPGDIKLISTCDSPDYFIRKLR